MIKYYCDFCNCDLTDSNGGSRWRLKLSNDVMNENSSMTTFDIFWIPPIEDDKDKYFCGFGCLKKWLEI